MDIGCATRIRGSSDHEGRARAVGTGAARCWARWWEREVGQPAGVIVVVVIVVVVERGRVPWRSQRHVMFAAVARERGVDGQTVRSVVGDSDRGVCCDGPLVIPDMVVVPVRQRRDLRAKRSDLLFK
jgi:hypothetical protein